MLKLSKNNGTPIGLFENYRELYLYINHIENMKLLPDHPEFGQSCWSFMVLSPRRVVDLQNTLKLEYDPEIVARAIKEGSGIIEMCRGDIKNPLLIIDSSRVDVEGFRKDWCYDYCDAHEMTIIEFN